MACSLIGCALWYHLRARHNTVPTWIRHLVDCKYVPRKTTSHSEDPSIRSLEGMVLGFGTSLRGTSLDNTSLRWVRT